MAKAVGTHPLRRVTINLTTQANDTLDRLGDETGQSRTDLINYAVAVFGDLVALQRAGGALYVRASAEGDFVQIKYFTP